MNPDEIRAVVVRTLGTIAPEADLTALKPNVSFREQLDIDSMDLLNFVIALHKEFQLDIPETDYAKLASLESCVGYLIASQANQPRR